MADEPGWIEQLYLDPGSLRRGIGSLLVADAKARNSRLELRCFAENRGGRAFYERHGFLAVEMTEGAGNEEKAPDIRSRWSRRART